jgi:hypothetical protein
MEDDMEQSIGHEVIPVETSTTLSTAKAADGLCGACERRTLCSLRVASAGPVLQCEEFAGAPSYVRCVERRPGETVAVATRVGVLGLCANCARFDTCAFPKPEGGIWQCEEYC